MKSVLIVSGHTDLAESFANRVILDELARQLPQAQQRRLDELRVNGHFDIAAEQQSLRDADVIVLQFPLFWYGAPSLLKQWMEEVFLYGFAFGGEAPALVGKQLLLSFTSGAPESMYQYGEPQGYPIEDFLPPLKQFANLCGLQWLGYVYTGGVSYASRAAEAERLQQASLAHAERVLAAFAEAGVVEACEVSE